jgi:hypothetical protein
MCSIPVTVAPFTVESPGPGKLQEPVDWLHVKAILVRLPLVWNGKVLLPTYDAEVLALCGSSP